MALSGLLLAALAAVFNGTFGVFAQNAHGVHPLVVNYWLAEGAGLSGLLLLALPGRTFTPWGLLSGVLFVLSSANAVAAIQQIGLAAASGVWCGTAVVASFAWGVWVAGDVIDRLPQAVGAVCLTLAGIAGIAVAARMGGGHAGAAGTSPELADGADSVASSLLMGNDHGYAAVTIDATPRAGGVAHAAASASPATPPGAPPAGGWQSRLTPRTHTLLGLAAAVAAGALGGLILAPMLAAPQDARGLPFVPSMAAGALLLAPAITALLVATGRVSFQHATSSRAAGPGMAAGVCWNAGNVCCILAVTDPHVGLAVATPIMQAGLFVAGCWGIALRREIRGWRALGQWAVSGAALVAGAALLADAKGGD